LISAILEGLSVRPSAIITDAMPLNLSDTHFHDVPVYFFPKGESKSSSIAAASIVAKVTRDAMMKLYDQAIPGYGLVDNKGYGTARHKKAIQSYSYSFIHRVHFVHNFLQRDESDQGLQLSLDVFRAHSELVEE
jgi:ribonuclease HII